MRSTAAAIDDEVDCADGESEHLVVEIQKATGLPASSSCFVALCVSDHSGALRGRRVCTSVRSQSGDPVWRCVRDLAVAPSHDDLLLVQLFTPDWCTCVGSTLVAASQLTLDVPLQLPLHRVLDPRTAGSLGSGFVTVCGRAWKEGEHRGRTLFLIRHGESRWNEAQKARRLGDMLALDHPLTRLGAQQSMSLREQWAAIQNTLARDASVPYVDLLGLDERFGEESCADPAVGPDADVQWVEAFFAANFVASSPLTRALQTALLALRGHPAVDARGVTLLRCLREVKGSQGSLDSIGRAVGADCRTRAELCLREALPESGVLVNDACAARVDATDAATPWWTPNDEADGEAAVAERVADLTSAVQFAPAGPVILVGHSLLFREVVRRCAGTELTAALPDLTARLVEGKLSNGGCLGLQVIFVGGRMRIVNASLMFASTIVNRHD